MMNHALPPSSVRRSPKPSTGPSLDVDDDTELSFDDSVAILEESFRSSAFALVPSALSPSRTPSNGLIASSRALFFERPVHLDFASGWKKGTVTDWYNVHKAKGSTAIDKIQLRKNYQHPYYHEYIVVSTRGGYAYRIDRRPDADTPFDTIMKSGCTAYDTIEEVRPNALKELGRTSGCVVELHWRGEQTIDLLIVLYVCFAIHNDKWAKRYTLQSYNCYFLSWAIIVITMRTSAICGTGLKMAVIRSIRRPDSDIATKYSAGYMMSYMVRWKQNQGLERELERKRELEPELERLESKWGRKWGRKLVLVERERERVRERELKLKREVEWERERELERELELELEWAAGVGGGGVAKQLREQEQELMVMRERKYLLEQVQMQVQVQRQMRAGKRMGLRELAQSLALKPGADLEWGRERELELESIRVQLKERENELKCAREQWGQVLNTVLNRVLDIGQVPLGLGWGAQERIAEDKLLKLCLDTNAVAYRRVVIFLLSLIHPDIARGAPGFYLLLSDI
jgi:hypothetical protein